MADFLYSVDGIPLTDAAGRWWVTHEGSAHSAPLSFRSVKANVPGMHGTPDPGQESREESALPLRVMVANASAAQREEYWEAVKALFTLAIGGTFVLTREVAGVARSTKAKLGNVSVPDFRPGAGMLVGIITVRILDGAFHDEPEDFVVDPFNANFSAQEIAIAGTLPTEDWAIRLEGPLTAFAAADVASGTGVSWGGVATAGQFVFLRGFEARLSSDAGDWESGGVDVSGGVSRPAAGLLALTPRPNGGDATDRSVRWSCTRAGSTSATALTLRAGGTYA